MLNLSIYFNNIAGYLAKRTQFMNSMITDIYDIIILQETNIKEEHFGYDDFSLKKMLGMNLHYADTSYFSRGTLVAWNPNVVEAKKQIEHTAAGHEISTIKLSSGIDSLTLISAYRSPSTKDQKGRTESYFTALVDTISKIDGKILLVGDLNLVDGRKIHHHIDEGLFLKQICNIGLRSIIRGITHPSHANQLDYAFTNIPKKDISAKIIAGFNSDHHAFDIKIEIKAEIITVPKKYVIANKSIPSETIDDIVDWMVGDIIAGDNEVGDDILELELFLWEIKNYLFDIRTIPEHRRVRGFSRQNSKVILETAMDPQQKKLEIRKNLIKDASRNLTKNLGNNSPCGKRIMGCFSMAAKSQQILTCKLDPEGFKTDILDDEKLIDHSKHLDTPFGLWRHLIQPLDEEETETAITKLKSKWQFSGGFSEKFWRYTASRLLTEKDTGVHSYSYVETVIKDKSAADTRKGWRLVWKASSLHEKLYDLLRSMLVRSEQLLNDAYCAKRSTQRALAKVSCWDINDSHGLLGCDYKNAFGLACRPCANELLGFEFLNSRIEFRVNTAAGSSESGASITGTGAGRATGGPGFNIIFNHHINTHPFLKQLLNILAPFADDSQVKTPIHPPSVRQVTEAFKDGKKYGLFMHETGKKGPTFLVKKEQVESVTGLFLSEGFDANEINIVKTVKFLGVDIKICSKKNIMVANMTSSAVKKMNFFVSELNKTYRLANYSMLPTATDDTFLASSFAIASTIESRIQYSIMFLCERSLCNAINIHKRTICTLTGKSFRFFGFKNAESKKEDFVEDLFGMLANKCSATYLILCKALGRPSIIQMALRSAMVVLEQINEKELTANFNEENSSSRTRMRDPPFLKKIKNFIAKCEDEGINNTSPRLNENYERFFQFKTFQQRRIFLKVLTDNQVLNQLNSKGWTADNNNCRFKNCSGGSETMDHLLEQHIDLNLQPAGIRRELKRLRNIEKKCKQGQRIIMHPNIEAATVITEIYDSENIKEPPLKMVRKENS